MGSKRNKKYDSLKKAQKANIDIGEHLYLNLSDSDRMLWEASPDGEHVLAEHTPSTMSVKTRWARRLEKKFQLPLEKAWYLSYCMGIVCYWNTECLRDCEQQIQEKGFQEVFNEMKRFAFELLQLEPKDEIRSFNPGIKEYHPVPLISEDEEPDWESIQQELTETDEIHPILESYLNRRFGNTTKLIRKIVSHPDQKEKLEKKYRKIEEGYNSFFKEYGVTDFPLTSTQAEAITDILQKDWENKNGSCPNAETEKDEKIEKICTKIRKAGADKISEMGKKLYTWSKDRRIKEYFGDFRLQLVWSTFKRRKAQLEPFKLALLYQK